MAWFYRGIIIGAKLKKIREQKRFSQKDIAVILGISQKTYSNIESDKSKIGIKQLAKLSEILNFDLFVLLQEYGITLNQSYNNFFDKNNMAMINDYHNKLIKQMELRLQEKDEIIRLLKEQLNLYKQKS